VAFLIVCKLSFDWLWSTFTYCFTAFDKFGLDCGAADGDTDNDYYCYYQRYHFRCNYVCCYSPVVDPGFGEFCAMPGLNHLNICKPHSRSAVLYQKTLQFIHHSLPMSCDPAAAGSPSQVSNDVVSSVLPLFI